MVSLVLSLAACGTAPAASNATSAVAEKSTAAEEPAPTKPAEKVVLKYAIPLDAAQDTSWDKMINTANELLAPKNIEIKPLRIAMKDWPDYYQKVVSMFAAGQGPDMGRAAERLMPSFIDKGQAMDITTQLGELDMSQYYDKTFMASSYSGGKYYGIPSGVYYYVMYFNKDLFDKAGLPYPSSDWSKPTTLDQIAEYAKKLTTGEGANKTFGFYCDPRPQHVGLISSLGGGDNAYDKDWNPTLNGESSKQVYRWFDTLLQGKLMPRPTDTRILGAGDMFIQGKLAMLIEGTWIVSRMSEVTNFKPGYAVIPSPVATNSETLQFVDAFLIFSSTKYPKESWEAMKALVGKEGEMALATSTVAGTSIFKEANDKYMNETLAKMTTPEELKMFGDAMNRLRSMPYNVLWEESLAMVLNIRDEWLSGKMTPDAYADKAQELYLKVKSEAD